jgi:hypothetical protein
VLDRIAQEIKDAGPSAPAVNAPAQWFLFEHEDDRYAVSSSSEQATFAAGFPGWHRVEPMEVHGIVTPAAIGQTLTDQQRTTIQQAADTAHRILCAGGDCGDKLSDFAWRRDQNAWRDALHAVLRTSESGQ